LASDFAFGGKFNSAVWGEEKSMKNRLCFTTVVFIVYLILLDSIILTSRAVYEGTANANMMIRRYERKGEYGKAALWREAAAKCLDMISIPLAKIIVEYCQRIGDMGLAQKMEAEVADTESRRDEHLKRAKLDWEKAEEDKKALDAERSKIGRFTAEWVPHYPDRFYEFGTYRNVFRKRIDELKEQRKFGEALLLEADASDMCARQYEEVTIKYFRDRAKAEHTVSSLDTEKIGDKNPVLQSQRQAEAYQKVRDEHLRRSAMLRALAKQNPESWPEMADRKDFDVPQSEHKLTADKAMKLARENERIQQILEGHKNVREFVCFQGFCWTVSYYSHDWANLGIAFVDDEAGKVIDILTSPGDLEEREWDEEEERRQELRLSPEKIIEIAKKHPKVKSYFKKHPNAKANAAYNWRYNCWVMEVILNGREVGVVTVSDRTEEVLEVAVEQK
jgi:hypothetical protein